MFLKTISIGNPQRANKCFHRQVLYINLEMNVFIVKYYIKKIEMSNRSRLS